MTRCDRFPSDCDWAIKESFTKYPAVLMVGKQIENDIIFQLKMHILLVDL